MEIKGQLPRDGSLKMRAWGLAAATFTCWAPSVLWWGTLLTWEFLQSSHRNISIAVLWLSQFSQWNGRAYQLMNMDTGKKMLAILGERRWNKMLFRKLNKGKWRLWPHLRTLLERIMVVTLWQGMRWNVWKSPGRGSERWLLGWWVNYHEGSSLQHLEVDESTTPQHTCVCVTCPVPTLPQ